MRFLHNGISDQYRASVSRLKDAEVLAETKRWQGAMYIAGYALECRLKSVLMEKFDVSTLQGLDEELKKRNPTFKSSATHNLRALFSFMNLSKIIEASDDQKLKNSRNLAFQWSVDWRYSPDAETEKTCAEFIAAIRDMVHRVSHAE